MTPQTEQEIEKLRTLNDNYTELVDIFDHLVPREYVVLTLSAPSDVDWTMYSVVVTNNDKGTSDTYVIPSNGVVEFEVKYDTTYTIQLPILGDLIAPKGLTFTAGMKMREVWYSYRMVGVFGMDVNGKCYTIEQIEALEDKSIIKYGGYTDYELEASPKENTKFSNGVIWIIGNEFYSSKFASASFTVPETLLPLTSQVNTARKYYDGEAYTKYIIDSCEIQGVNPLAATWCTSQYIITNSLVRYGFVLSFGQLSILRANTSLINSLYTALGLPNISFGGVISSNQATETQMLGYSSAGVDMWYTKTSTAKVFCGFSL